MRTWLTRTAAGSLAVLILFSSSIRAQQLAPLEAAPVDAKLLAADAQWNLTFAPVTGAARQMPTAELLRWGKYAEPRQGEFVILADGGLLVAAEVLAIENEQLLLDADYGPVRLPVASLAGLVLRPPTDRAARETLADRLLFAEGAEDRLLLTNGDELAGSVTALTANQVELKAAGGMLKIDRARIAAIRFSPALRGKTKLTGIAAWVGLSDGSRLLATSLIIDGNTAKLTMAGGGSVQLPATEIAAIQPIGVKSVYLSDLPASSYKHIPFLQTAWPYRNDRSVTGGMLRSGGQRFLKGLGMHSAARLTYDLNDKFHTFQATLAIDDSALDAEGSPRGSIIGRIFTDDGFGQWQLRYESPVIRGGAPGVPVKVDVAGAKRLSLLVDFADRGDELDRANWLDARLVR